MEKNKIKYYSLEEAREEIKKRWNDIELKKQIEEELGKDFIPEFSNYPRGVFSRYIMSPDNTFTFFMYCAKYIKCKPLFFEYFGDKFTTINEEKKGLGKLHLILKNENYASIKIIDFYKNENQKIEDVVMLTGERLVDFYKKLFDRTNFICDKKDTTIWNHSFGKPIDYYYPFFLHFIAHGVLFENFIDNLNDTKESAFTSSVVLPSFKRIFEKYGVSPIVVKLLPDDQTLEEDFFWWSFPPYINEYLEDFVDSRDFKINKHTTL
jgi:hypothetical protein